MKQYLALFGVCALTVGCSGLHEVLHSGPQVKGSGNVKTEKRTVSDFSRIETRGSADCEVKVGEATSVQISADDNILPLIETTVESGTLVVSMKGNISTRNPIKLTISTPKLEAYSVKGSGDANLHGISTSSFDLSVFGSGDVVAQGQADRVTATIKGSGDLNLEELMAKDADASISGSGDIHVHASGKLSASISGSGNIAYSGNPQTVDKSVAGSGEIHPR